MIEIKASVIEDGFQPVHVVGGIDLRKTLESGQVFRFRDITNTEPGSCLRNCDEGAYARADKFMLFSRDKAAIAIAGRYVSDNVLVKPLGVPITHTYECMVELRYWSNYLNGLRSQVVDAMETIACIRSATLQSMVNYSYGIRILAQDPWETLASFIISQRNSIPRIKSSIEEICSIFGTKHRGYLMGHAIQWHGFPSVEQLLHTFGVNTADALGNKCRLGYRVGYLVDTANELVTRADMVRGTPDKYLDGLYKRYSPRCAKSDELLRVLQAFKGVGKKVASCTALFAFQRLDLFPVDVWIDRAMHELSSEVDFNNLGPAAGLIQQYIYNYMIHSSKAGEQGLSWG